MSAFNSHMRQNIYLGLPTRLHQKQPDLVIKKPNSKYKMDTVLQLVRVIDVIQFQIFKAFASPVITLSYTFVSS